MADTDLDSFFARKDKKKKDKKKGVSNDDLDKKFDNKPTTGERSRERRFPILDNFIQDEGEWEDFKDENDKDYSGLKIQTLSIKDKEEEQREEEESIKKKEEAIKPWAFDPDKVDEAKTETANSEPETKIDEDDIEAQLMANRGGLNRFRGGNRNATGPRLDDSKEFPDLGTTSEAYEDLKTYTTVRTSGPQVINRSGPEAISTDNKYSALRNAN